MQPVCQYALEGEAAIAAQKIQNLHPKFQLYTAVYNDHGVAVYGNLFGNYSLYWANPSEKKVKLINTMSTTELIPGNIVLSAIKSYDATIHLDCRYRLGSDFLPEGLEYYLNSAPAQILPLKK